MTVSLSENMRQFVAEVMPAVVGTRRRNGTVQMNSIWYEFRDGLFWLNSWQGSHWMDHVERDKDVTLLFLDPHNMFRFAQVQGRLIEKTTAGADEQIDRLSVRYTGNPVYQKRQPGMQRVILTIEPLRITGSIDARW